MRILVPCPWSPVQWSDAPSPAGSTQSESRHPREWLSGTCCAAVLATQDCHRAHPVRQPGTAGSLHRTTSGDNNITWWTWSSTKTHHTDNNIHHQQKHITQTIIYIINTNTSHRQYHIAPNYHISHSSQLWQSLSTFLIWNSNSIQQEITPPCRTP